MAEERGEIVLLDSFPLAFNCELEAVNERGEIIVTIRLDVTEPAPRYAMGGKGGGSFHVPARVFRDQAQRNEWISRTLARLQMDIAGAMMHEAMLLLIDSGNYHLDFMGVDPEPTTKNELVKIHLNETEQRVRKFLGAKGQRSQWTRAELERAVTTARRSLGKPNATLDEVAEVLRRTHPKKGPASGEALGATLRRFKINWKGIKTDS
jgi:hypothetical protein